MDPKEEFSAALRRLRKAAISQRARRDGLAEELARLEALAERAQDSEELRAQIAATREALDAAEADYGRSRAQLEAAPKLEDELERATLLRQIRELEHSDPFDPSAEDVALGNVRDAAAELDAELHLSEELSGGGETERPPRVDPEQRAREELARLKAERKAKK